MTTSSGWIRAATVLVGCAALASCATPPKVDGSYVAFVQEVMAQSARQEEPDDEGRRADRAISKVAAWREAAGGAGQGN